MIWFLFLLIPVGSVTISNDIDECIAAFPSVYMEKEYDTSVLSTVEDMYSTLFGEYFDLETIFIVKNIDGFDGLYHDGSIVLSSESVDIERTFVHEIGHYVLRNSRKGFNLFPYLGNKWDKVPRRQGYVSQYAMYNYHEDMAETFVELFTMYRRKQGLVYDPIIQKKITYVAEYANATGRLSDISGFDLLEFLETTGSPVPVDALVSYKGNPPFAYLVDGDYVYASISGSHQQSDSPYGLGYLPYKDVRMYYIKNGIRTYTGLDSLYNYDYPSYEPFIHEVRSRSLLQIDVHHPMFG